MRAWRVLTLALFAGFAVLTAGILARAETDGPLLTLRFASTDVLIWALIGLSLPLIIGLSGIAAARRRARRLERAATVIDGIAIIDRRGRALWHNAAAAPMITRRRIAEPVAGLVDRAVRGGRAVSQTLSLGEDALYAFQAQPLDRESAVITCRPVVGSEGQSAFYENFIRRIVHDMRNPLAGIIGHAANMSGAAVVEPESWRRSAKIIESEANRLTRLVDSVLFDARLSYVPPNWTKLDLVDVVEDAVYRQDERAVREGKTLLLDAPPDPMPIEADRELLLRAFQNLIDNGLKYSGADGRVRVVLLGADNGYQVRIEDNGVGIPASYLPDRIFDPMVRAGAGGDGTGLGLSIVRKIVELHSGTIRADSRVGEGTQMIIDLPARR